MATFGEFIKNERNKKGLSQSDFGQPLRIIMTDISKIENGKKRFPFDKLNLLAEYLKKDFTELKNIYVAERLVEEARKYGCSDIVFKIAEKESQYQRSKKIKQGKMNF